MDARREACSFRGCELQGLCEPGKAGVYLSFHMETLRQSAKPMQMKAEIIERKEGELMFAA